MFKKIFYGFLGLIQNRMRLLDNESVSNILTRGGTILGSNNKIAPRKYPMKIDGKIEIRDVTDRCMEYIAENSLDALVVIGGDGSMSIAADFVQMGINCIGVPKTIDNDLYGTDVTFGFATAVMVATDALDRVHTTAASHHRVMIIEVMGRNAGWIALHSGPAIPAREIVPITTRSGFNRSAQARMAFEGEVSPTWNSAVSRSDSGSWAVIFATAALRPSATNCSWASLPLICTDSGS